MTKTGSCGTWTMVSHPESDAGGQGQHGVAAGGRGSGVTARDNWPGFRRREGGCGGKLPEHMAGLGRGRNES